MTSSLKLLMLAGMYLQSIINSRIRLLPTLPRFFSTPRDVKNILIPIGPRNGKILLEIAFKSYGLNIGTYNFRKRNKTLSNKKLQSLRDLQENMTLLQRLLTLQALTTTAMNLTDLSTTIQFESHARP